MEIKFRHKKTGIIIDSDKLKNGNKIIIFDNPYKEYDLQEIVYGKDFDLIPETETFKDVTEDEIYILISALKRGCFDRDNQGEVLYEKLITIYNIKRRDNFRKDNIC